MTRDSHITQRERQTLPAAVV